MEITLAKKIDKPLTLQSQIWCHQHESNPLDWWYWRIEI